MVALSAFHESPFIVPSLKIGSAIHGWGIAQEREKSRRDERTVAIAYGVFSKSRCPKDSNMASRRCNLRCTKKETRPREGSYKDGRRT